MSQAEFDKLLRFLRATHPSERTQLEQDIIIMADVHRATARRMAEGWIG